MLQKRKAGVQVNRPQCVTEAFLSVQPFRSPTSCGMCRHGPLCVLLRSFMVQGIE